MEDMGRSSTIENTTRNHVRNVELTRSEQSQDSSRPHASFPASDDRCFKYRSLIQNSQSVLLMMLAHGLREQDNSAAEKSKLAMIEYKLLSQPVIKKFVSSRELLQYLEEDEQTSRTEPEPRSLDRSRLFILEDVSRNYIEILGSRLKVHPTVFARHWGDLGFLESVDDVHTTNGQTSRLTIPFPTFLNAPRVLSGPQESLEELYLANFNVRRITALPKPFGSWDLRSSILEMESCISYWSHMKDCGVFDALIIVDPPMNDTIHLIKTHPSHMHQLTRKDSRPLKLDLSPNPDCIPNFANLNTLPSSPKDWDIAERTVSYGSMFDKLVTKYSTLEMKCNQAPTDFLTPIVRRIALEKWNKFLNHAIHCLVLTKGEPYANNSHFNSPISMLWAPTIEEWLLARLVKWSRRLGSEQTTLNTILRSFGTSAHSNHGGHGMLSATEAEQWRFIRDKMIEYKALYDDTTASYIQVMGLREAQSSNAQARNIGRISIVGALFVPVSLVSGIMSMGGEFIPGGSRFWVFVAVTIPTVAVFCTLLFADYKRWVGGLRVVYRKEELSLPTFHEKHFHERC